MCYYSVNVSILDCYKYLCVSYDETIRKFRNAYKEVNLNLADSGKFLPKLNELDAKAKGKLLITKEFEIKTHLDDREENDNSLYTLYEVAYTSYKEIDDFIKESHEAIQFACAETKKSDLINKASLIFGAAGLLVGILSIVISLLL